jgi:hypothetical protein
MVLETFWQASLHTAGIPVEDLRRVRKRPCQRSGRRGTQSPNREGVRDGEGLGCRTEVQEATGEAIGVVGHPARRLVGERFPMPYDIAWDGQSRPVVRQ